MRRLALSLVVAFGLAAPVAHAADDAQAAQDTFKEAQELFDHGHPDQALDKFRAAFKATGSPNARLYVARSLREMGRLAEAYEEMRATLDEARTRADTEPRYVPTRDAAAAELSLLERRVGRVVVAVADAPSGLHVTIGGVPVPADRVGKPVAVAPGKIAVTASAPGRALAERRIDVAAGELSTVAIALEEPGAATKAAPPPPLRDAPPPVASSRPPLMGWVALGVGAAGFVTFGVAGAMANSKYSELQDLCGAKRCTDPRFADEVDKGKRYDTIANVGLIVGGVGTLAGVGILLFGGKSTQEKQTAFVQAGPRGASVQLRGAF